MSNVTKRPTAATSFYRVRRSGKLWMVELVTPSWPKPLRTALQKFADRDVAISEANKIGALRQRPVKISGGAA